MMDVQLDETWPVFVVEDEPPATRPRWYCHGTPGFDTPEEAVRSALSTADSVIVRTLDGTCYWAGQAPKDFGEPLRAWPPDRRRREQIDRDYDAAVARARAETEARCGYERARTAWLRANAAELAD